MTDNEIKKALECCFPNNAVICRKVNMGGEFNDEIESISEITIADIVDLINRLQAEIEDLKKVVVDDYASEYDNKIKAEAYKECIEMVKDLFDEDDVCSRNWLDTILKKMVGEGNA